MNRRKFLAAVGLAPLCPIAKAPAGTVHPAEHVAMFRVPAGAALDTAAPLPEVSQLHAPPSFISEKERQALFDDAESALERYDALWAARHADWLRRFG